MIISVVTPSFNQGRFIEETIKSVFSQAGDFFIDYIIMDGGSTDNSVQVIGQYDRMLKEGSWPVGCRGITCRWVSEKDGGQVDALKKGFALATGDILCWLNSDDIFLSHGVLNTVVSHFSASPEVQLLTGDGLFIDVQGKELGVHHVDAIRIPELLFLDYHILQPSTFFRKETYHSTSLNERYACAFDADFFIGLLLSGVRYKKIEDRLAGFRYYPEIKTRKLAARRYKEQMQIAWQHSKNILYLFISAFYRFVEIVVRAKYENHPLFPPLFRVSNKAAYRLIMGRSANRLFVNS